MEIRKREAKVFLMSKQIEDIEDTINANKENGNQANLQSMEEEEQSL